MMTVLLRGKGTRSFSILFFSCVAAVLACSQPTPQAEASARANGQSRAAESSPTVESVEQATALPETQSAPVDEWTMRLQLPDVVEKAMPSVVGISTERTVRQRTSASSPFDDPFFRQFGPFFGPPSRQVPPRQSQPRERVHQGIGSGVIVNKEGVVLTNNHVIEGADTIIVNLYDGRELRAQIKGADPASDLAVLQIEEVPENLKPIAFGDSDALRLGESVIAIGNPFGLSGTVTLGIISAKGRANVGLLDYEDFIQTDAAINPGNSGGALLNLRGELVGINTAIMSRSGGYQGVGFAIPSNMAQVVMNSLVETGQVDRGWLGVHLQQLTPELAGALEVDKSVRGVVVADVQPESPAQKAGLERGDVIVSIDGTAVRTPAAVRNTVGLRAPGAKLEIDFVRRGERQSLAVTLGSLQTQSGLSERAEAGEERVASAIDGLEVRGLDREIRRQFNLPDTLAQGLVVTGVEEGSKAQRLDLRPGDVILEVNRRPVNSTADLAAVFREGEQNLFLLYRNGATVFMAR